MTEMAFELGWIITNKGGLRRSVAQLQRASI